MAPIFVRGSRAGTITGSNRGQKMETGERGEFSESETRAVLEQGVSGAQCKREREFLPQASRVNPLLGVTTHSVMD